MAMEEESTNKIKLGTFVLIAISCLLLGLYYIGSKKNIFHSTINVSTNFSNIGGLMSGNNVRYNGINVGTVTKVFATSDTTIKVIFTIDKESTAFIGKNCMAAIGTDGLLGNKLINITPGKKGALPIEEGDVMKAINPMQMDNALRTLTMSGDNLKVITDNLREFSENLNEPNSFWHLFKDTLFTNNVKASVVNLKLMSNQALLVTGDLHGMTDGIKHGKGSLGALITDTVLSAKIKQVVVKFEKISDSAAIISGDISQIIRKLKQGKGSMGILLNDTMLIHNLNESVLEIDTAAGSFDENMKALHSSWPFKKYFKKQK
jgi:phospholipid/cholesterol/gamma-HCH transport system substrate-binding protein